VKLGVTANCDVPEALKVARFVRDRLKGQDVTLETGIARILGQEGSPIEDMDIDALITIGGDGTILRSLQRTTSPIFAINAGVLGFLTEVNGFLPSGFPNMIDEAGISASLERLLAGSYFMDERIKLKTVIGGHRMMDATNEAVVHTAHVAKIRDFKVRVDGQLALNVRADGIMMSTPTGSTCYALAVGSPVIDPRVDAFVIAPMAPFKFAARPIVVPASSKVEVEVARPKPCITVVDGQQEMAMDGPELVQLSLSEHRARFIRFKHNFYGRMNEKLVCLP